jgi:ubiquinone/menaquinone biosynthesis C-methylase UbiE
MSVARDSSERRAAPSVDLHKAKLGQQEAWGSGELGKFAATIVIVSETLCETLDMRAGQKVLDVATGTGNTAIAAARRWCVAIGIDFVGELLRTARNRALVEGMSVSFVEGDAEAIPFEGESFDVVASTFGSMFAPDHERAAGELIRTCRPGGKIGMTNFPPDSLAGEFFRTTARYVPPPRGLRPSVLWGLKDYLHQLFRESAAEISIQRRSLYFRYLSPEHWLNTFRIHFGPVRSAFEQLDDRRQRRLSADLLRLIDHFNISGDDTVVAPCDYVEVVIVKR